MECKLFCKFASGIFHKKFLLIIYIAMIVIVNDCRIRIFRGATVGDVLLRYAVRNSLELSVVPALRVTDKWGHTLDHAAPLTDKQSIKIINL